MSGTMTGNHGDNRTVTAVFDDETSAERAARELATAVGGVRGRIYTKNDADFGALSLPHEDRDAYDEAIRRGNVVLSAEVPMAKFDAAADVMERCGAVDFDAREAEWRKQGWTANQRSATTGTTAKAGTAAGTTPATAGAAAPHKAEARQGDSIPIAEERLRVGKREMGTKRVRVRSYVVETPVEKEVTLRREHVDVERRPVDRAANAADKLFQERTIEASETREEPVVEKDVRVTEEVSLHKHAEQETEKVRDTVRRTKVEVDDDRGRTGADRPANDPRAPGKGGPSRGA